MRRLKLEIGVKHNLVGAGGEQIDGLSAGKGVLDRVFALSCLGVQVLACVILHHLGVVLQLDID